MMACDKGSISHGGRLVVFFCVLSLTPAWAGPLPVGVLQSVDPTVTFTDLLQAPTASVGRVVVLGGELIRATPGTDGTELEILQRPLAADKSPWITQASQGRFLVWVPSSVRRRFPERGSLLTVVGRVQGAQIREGETLPVLEAHFVQPWEPVFTSPPPAPSPPVPAYVAPPQPYEYPPQLYWGHPFWWPPLPMVIIIKPFHRRHPFIKVDPPAAPTPKGFVPLSPASKPPKPSVSGFSGSPTPDRKPK